MIDTLQIYNELSQAMDAAAAEKIAQTIGLIYEELRNTVTKTEFNELKDVVKELVEAQARTENRVEQLAEAQARTESRVGRLEAAMERLVEAQARTESRVGRLEAAMERLAEAQARTENRVGRLEAAMERLAEAQAKTERAVNRLSKQVGGLSDTVGGDIEDIAYIVLHDVLKREFGWQVGVLERVWKTWGKHPEEVTIFGQATDPTRPETVIWIVGEAKHNITKTEVKKFVKQVARAKTYLAGELFPVCFCYRARPEVQEMISDAGIRLVFSYGKLV